MADEAPQMTEAAKEALAKAKAAAPQLGAENTVAASPAGSAPVASKGPTVTQVEVQNLKPGEMGGKLTVTQH